MTQSSRNGVKFYMQVDHSFTVLMGICECHVTVSQPVEILHSSAVQN